MINYYWGNDREGARRAAQAELEARRGKFPASPFFELTSDLLVLEELYELIDARPLTGDKIIVFSGHLPADSAATDFIAENPSRFVASPNHFIFWEDESGKKLAAAIVRAGGFVAEFKITVDAKVSNDKAAASKLFDAADALGDRDRKRAWLLYHELGRDGVSAEEIFWKFVWKVRTLLLVETAPIGSAIPLKTYPLSQARRQVKKYKPGELIRLSSRLVQLYHAARRGFVDFDFSLERLILEL